MRSSLGVSERPLFFYDLASPYAYLAASRIGGVLPEAEWQPVLLGGLFKLNARHSWLYDDDREARQAEMERRAAVYGLPPMTWFRSVPTTWLTVMRAVTVAKRRGRVLEFFLAAFRAVHVAIARWIARGTMSGALDPPGYAPTNGAVEFRGVDVWEFKDGLISYWDGIYDVAGIGRQISALPAPGSRAERIGARLQRLTAKRMRRAAK